MKILIVEDEKRESKLMKTYFSFLGFEVDTIGSDSEFDVEGGIEKIANETNWSSYDFILLDDGIGFIEDTREAIWSRDLIKCLEDKKIGIREKCISITGGNAQAHGAFLGNENKHIKKGDISLKPHETLMKIVNTVVIANNPENINSMVRALNRSIFVEKWQEKGSSLYFISETGVDSIVIEGMPSYEQKAVDFFGSMNPEGINNRKNVLAGFITQGFCNVSGRMNWELVDSQDFSAESKTEVKGNLNYQ